MSVYTTEVRFICESSIPLAEQGNLSDVDTAIEAGRKTIFTFDYDLFDPLYKPVIETKFLRHYYTREIGLETVGLWKLRLRDLWEMKLPYYNKLWESELLKFNPLYDVDYTAYHTGDRFSNRTENSDSESTSKNSVSSEGSNSTDENYLSKFSDTPQGALNGVLDTDWLTNATENITSVSGTDKNTSSSLGNGTNKIQSVGDIHDIDDYQRHVVGKMGTAPYSKLLMDWRKSFLNIDEMFINEMNDLFMLIY